MLLNYVNGAPLQTLSVAVDNNPATTLLTVPSTAGYPATPFLLGLERGTGNSEVTLCTAKTATTFTVTRGFDGTPVRAHGVGTSVEHTTAAYGYNEASAHVNTGHVSVATGGTPPSASSPGDTSAVGVSADAARADHRHPRESFGVVVGITAGAATAAGTSASVAHADHVHGVAANTVPAASAVGATAAIGTSTDLARADHRHAREGAGAPAASAPGDTTATGAAATVALSDHRHAREGFGVAVGLTAGAASAAGVAVTISHSDHVHALPAGTPAGASAPGDTPTIGTSTEVARADHRHGREGFGGVPGALAAGGTGSAGGAATPSRSDHSHPLGASTAPVASVPGDTAAVGTSPDVARADHRHPREATESVSFPAGFGPLPFAGPVLPAGWLWCDGSEYSRVTYAALYAALGGGASPWGQGNGVNTFNVPNMAGRFPLGASGAHPLGQTGGEETHTLTAGEMPVHAHTINDPSHVHTLNDPGHYHAAADGNNDLVQTGIAGSYLSGTFPPGGGMSVGVASTSTKTTGVTAGPAYTGITANNNGGDQAHNNMPPYAAVNYIIKY